MKDEKQGFHKPLQQLITSSQRRPLFASGAIAVLAIFALVGIVFLPLQPASVLFRSAVDAIALGHSRLNGDLKQSEIHSTQDSARSSSCELWRGEWVPDASPPLYTNYTCPYILPNQNCLSNGRPDRDYLHWRWKPFDCELPPFDASVFLDSMRGKRLAFIGDSLAGNHMTSLLCMLAQVEKPQFVDVRLSEYTMCVFPSYNLTLTQFWSPFLVNHTVEHHNNSARDDVYTLHLDVPQTLWVRRLAEQHVAIISTGSWYHRKSLYYVNKTLLGASQELGYGVKTMDLLSAVRIVLANVLRHITTTYEGITVLRTVTVDHFEHGWWYDGGACDRTSPYRSDREGGIPPMPRENEGINKLQVEEFEKAVAHAKEPSKLKLLNVTYSAHLRPDGHPGKYRGRAPMDPPYDCLHWCLPGAIDMWSQLLFHVLQNAFDRLLN